MTIIARFARAAAIGIGLFSLAACATAQQSAPPAAAAKFDTPLSRYVDEARTFSVMFPGTPKLTAKTKDGQPDGLRYEGSGGSRAYLVDVTALRLQNKASDEAVLQAARDSHAKDATKLLLDERVLVSGRPARDMLVEKGGYLSYVRLVLNGDTLYQAISVGQQPSDTAAYFAKSLTPLP